MAIKKITRTRHGHSVNGGTREYRSWTCMLARCRNPNDPMFPYYGAIGIQVCDRWQSFVMFLIDMGPRPQGTTLERLDGTASYEPQNCKWATPSEQNRNRSCTRWITFGGITMCLTEWAQHIGITKTALSKRLKKWPLDSALTSPIDARKSHHAATSRRTSAPDSRSP